MKKAYNLMGLLEVSTHYRPDGPQTVWSVDIFIVRIVCGLSEICPHWDLGMVRELSGSDMGTHFKSIAFLYCFLICLPSVLSSQSHAHSKNWEISSYELWNNESDNNNWLFNVYTYLSTSLLGVKIEKYWYT